MALLTDDHKTDYGTPRNAAPTDHDTCYDCCLHGEYEEEFDEPEVGIKVYCEVFFGLLGSQSEVIKRCQRSIVATLETPPSGQGWFNIGSGWVCQSCRDEMEKRWDHRVRTLATTELEELMAG